MDGLRFDAWSRALALPGSRRRALGGLLVVAPSLLAAPIEPAAAGKKPCPPCRKRKKGKCKKKLPNGTACSGGVCQNGACVPVTSPPPPVCPDLQPSQDLQAAITAAAPGSTLTLCAGTWRLSSTITIDKALTLAGAGAGQTVLDGQGAVRVLQTQAPIGSEVRLQDVTITRGRAATGSRGNHGGGIYNARGCTLTLARVTITGNTATSFGGGIFNESTVTLRDGSQVTGNTAMEWGGGIYNVGVMTLQGSRVEGNTATDGGGIFNDLGAVTLETGSQVSGNTAGAGGGGIRNVDGRVTLQDGSRVEGNTATDGGGIYNTEGGFDGGTVTLQAGSRVTGNTATGNTATSGGGGIYNAEGTVILRAGSRVTGNTATSGGGGIYTFDTVIVEPQALVCDNTQQTGGQCFDDLGNVPITGDCPNPTGGSCPA